LGISLSGAGFAAAFAAVLGSTWTLTGAFLTSGFFGSILGLAEFFLSAAARAGCAFAFAVCLTGSGLVLTGFAADFSFTGVFWSLHIPSAGFGRSANLAVQTLQFIPIFLCSAVQVTLLCLSPAGFKVVYS
jgi:hypothetical protein